MLAALVLSAMVSMQPSAPWRATYATTAQAIADEATAAPLWRGDDGTRTAAWLTAIAWHESRWKPDAVDGRGALCLLQVDRSNLRRLGTTRAEVLADVRACVRAGLALVAESLRVCRGRPEGEWLTHYAAGGGRCDSARGRALSRVRVGLARRVLAGWMREGGS